MDTAGQAEGSQDTQLDYGTHVLTCFVNFIKYFLEQASIFTYKYLKSTTIISYITVYFIRQMLFPKLLKHLIDTIILILTKWAVVQFLNWRRVRLAKFSRIN